MDAPYHICMLNGCTEICMEEHHEPERSLMAKEDWDDPRFKRWLCRGHHNERHNGGLILFKIEHPEYDGVELKDYRLMVKTGGKT